MRIEPYTVGSIVHIVKRGARGMEIVRDTADKWRFVKILYLLNDEYQDTTWSRQNPDLEQTSLFNRPHYWPERKPLVSVLGWVLMPNHFHLLLCETQDGGVSKFLQRLGGSMTTYFNQKYQEQGSIFQGAYRSRTVDTDAYLRYVLAYIVVKNVMELYPGGLNKAIKEFDRSWTWASNYPFSSFQTAALGSKSPIIDQGKSFELNLPGRQFKREAYNMLVAHVQIKKELSSLLLEDW
jgi:putative transposase